MNRREFISNTGQMATAGLMLGAMSVNAFGSSDAAEASQPKPTGALVLYYEFKIAGPQKAAMLTDIDNIITTLSAKAGFLGLTLKQTYGKSTAVDNMEEKFKQKLSTAYFDMANITLPNFYTLFVRFDSYDNLIASKTKEWFIATVQPRLFAYSKDANGAPIKTPVVLDYYQGIYKTYFAADRSGAFFKTQTDIVAFARNQQDLTATITNDVAPTAYLSVANHISLQDSKLTEFLTKMEAGIALNKYIYRPMPDGLNGAPNGTPDGTVYDGNNTTAYNATLDPNDIGISSTGAVGDHNYRKAITREILINAYSDGNLRSLIMNGLWESAEDHENSHIDPRFKAHMAPIGPYIVTGPVEPFYKTIKLHNN